MREVTYSTMPPPRSAADDLLPGSTLDEHQAELANWHRRHSHPALVLGAVLVILVTATVTAGLYLGVKAATTSPGPSPAERQATALHALRADLEPQLDAFMDARTSFFAAERTYRSATKQARAAVRAYLEAAETQWQPDLPDVDREIAELRHVASTLVSLKVGLLGLQPVDVLAPPYRQLLAAIETLSSDATNNAGTLDDGVGSALDGTRIVDPGVLSGLSGNGALPAIKQLNRSLVSVLDAAQLARSEYDVPGGTDLSPDDDSTAL